MKNAKVTVVNLSIIKLLKRKLRSRGSDASQGAAVFTRNGQLLTHTAVDVDFAAGGADVVTAAAGAADVMRIRAVATWCVAA